MTNLELSFILCLRKPDYFTFKITIKVRVNKQGVSEEALQEGMGSLIRKEKAQSVRSAPTPPSVPAVRPIFHPVFL